VTERRPHSHAGGIWFSATRRPTISTGRHELDFVAMCTEASSPVMRAATSFHPDEHGGQLRDKGHPGTPRHALAKHDLARVVHPHCMKHALCAIDPEDIHLLLHEARLLWLSGFTALAPIVAHCRRSAQGRVHFINAAGGEEGAYVAHAPCLLTTRQLVALLESPEAIAA